MLLREYVNVSPGSEDTLVRRGGIANHHSIADSLINICAKNQRNRLMCIEAIVCNVSVVFLRHSVQQHVPYWPRGAIGIGTGNSTVANVTRNSLTWQRHAHEDVVRVGRVSRMIRGCYEEVTRKLLSWNSAFSRPEVVQVDQTWLQFFCDCFVLQYLYFGVSDEQLFLL